MTDMGEITWQRNEDGIETYWLPHQYVGFDDPIKVTIERIAS